jgi:hypothetical protein
MRPPKNQILENLYTRGNEYILAKTYDNYVGYYHSVSGKYYIGATYNSKAISLIPYTERREAAAYNLSKIDPVYMRNNPNIINIIKKDAFPIVRVTYQVTTPPIYRFFIKRINEINSPILEVNKQTYVSAKDTKFYYTTSVLWDDLAPFSTINFQQLERDVPGINTFLNNYSTFGSGDETVEGRIKNFNLLK